MQDLVGISITHTTEQAGISKGALQGMVFGGERGSKRGQVCRKNVNTSGIERTQVLLAEHHMEGGTARGAGLCEHETAVGKIESGQGLTS